MHFPRKIAAWLCAPAAALAALLAGCAAPPATVAASAPAVPAGAPTANAQTAAANATLDADLLYDLLVADIARQRGRDAAAMDAAARAAYRSRDRRIVAQAVRLAARLEDHRRVIELSRLLAALAPDDFRNQLTLANAQLKIGQTAPAFAVLIAVARKQAADERGEAVLQSIASLLAEAAESPPPASAPSPPLFPQFRAAIAAWPNNAQLQFTAALFALERKRGRDFQQFIDQTLRLRPDWQAAAEFKLTYLSEHFPGQAARFAAVFLRDFPTAARFRVHHARLLLDAGRPAQAAAQTDAALRHDPQSSEALFVSAIAHFEQAQYATALRRMQKYLELNPRSDRARLTIADIHIAREQLDAAAETLREVDSPRYRLDAQVTLASVLAKQHGVDAGIRHLEQVTARNLDQAVRVFIEQAQLLRDYDDLARAKAKLDAGLVRFPAHPDLLYNRGLLAAQLNLLDQHERDMRQLIAQQPNNAHAYNALGYTLADQTDRLDEAFTLISKALKLRPKDPFILDSMGWVHFRLGDNDTAIDYLRRALAIREDAEIAAHLGEVLWAVGRKKEARAIWEKGKSWSPDNATLLDTLKRFSPEKSSAIGARIL